MIWLFLRMLAIACLMGCFTTCQQAEGSKADEAFTYFYAASEVEKWRGFYLGTQLDLGEAVPSDLVTSLAAYRLRLGAPLPWAILSRDREESAGEVLVLLHADLYLDPAWPSVTYGAFTIHQLPKNQVASQLDDKWYVFEQQSSLERLLDQVNGGLAETIPIPLLLQPNYPLAILSAQKPRGAQRALLSEKGWCFVVDTAGVQPVISEGIKPRRATASLLELLSLVPAAAVAFTLYPAAQSGLPLLELELFEGAYLMAAEIDGSQTFPAPSSQYLQVGIWEEPQDRLGWGADVIFYYAMIDGYLWQSDDLGNLHALILRAAGQPPSFLDRIDVRAVLLDLAGATFIRFFPYKISREESRQLLVYQRDREAFVRFLSDSKADRLSWEIDLEAAIDYWKLSPYSGSWLAQSSGGQISIGQNTAHRKLGFFAPLLAGPFTAEKAALLWQTEAAVYRYAEGQLDSLVFSTSVGGHCFRDPQREAFMCLLIAEDGQIQAIDSQLKPYPLWERTATVPKAITSPAVLQDEEGQASFVFMGEGEQLFALDRSGRLLWKQEIAGLVAPERRKFRASGSTAPWEELGSCVSQYHPYQALHLRSEPSNLLIALRVATDKVALLTADGKAEIITPKSGATISGLLVADTDGDGTAELLLRYEREVHAFSLEEDMKPLWLLRMEADRFQLFRDEAARKWGVFYPEQSLAVIYQGKQEERRFHCSHPPAYELLDGRYLQLRGSLLSAKK